MVLPLRFHRQREGRGNRLWIFWREVHGPRADDHVAERRPNGGQVSKHFSIQLLHVEPGFND